MNKEKLQEQIGTMREELAKMETELAECEKVELKGGSWYIEGSGRVKCNSSYSSKESIQNGARRATKELAKIASKNMVTRNKLEAYAHQIDPKWRDLGIEYYKGTGDYNTYYIYIEYDGKYTYGVSCYRRILGAVYMSESTAKQICERLNDGRIEL